MSQSILDRTNESREQYELDMKIRNVILTFLQMMATPHDDSRRELHLEVRNAMLVILRAWEKCHDLPRSIPTNYERKYRTEVIEPGEHHKR